MASRGKLRAVAAEAADDPLDHLESASFDRAKRSFLAAMSHELRTPLNAIIGFAEIMDAEMLGPMKVAQYRHYVHDILGSGRHLLRIIEDVLEITQAEAREMVLNKREVPLRELVALARANFDAICAAREIEVIVRIPEDLVVQVDPDKFRRVLACLLSNAVKFGKDGGKILIAADLCDLSRVTIRIEDDGIGIDPSAIERAFAPFVQLEDKLSRCFEGTGLGLPLARMLTELHGGTVDLLSAPGAGTTAIVALPAYASA
jgi:signal transduction histidine kinase